MAINLADQGLFAREVYYRADPPDLVETLRALAQRLGLFTLGGSDFHGIERNDERQPGEIPLPDSVVEAFIKALQAEGCAVPEPTPAP
jgi:hypothetical protein